MRVKNPPSVEKKFYTVVNGETPMKSYEAQELQHNLDTTLTPLTPVDNVNVVNGVNGAEKHLIENSTYRELGAKVGKTTNQVRYAVSQVELVTGIELHVPQEGGGVGVAKLLSAVGVELVTEYLDSPGLFKAKYTKALAVQEEDDIQQQQQEQQQPTNYPQAEQEVAEAHRKMQAVAEALEIVASEEEHQVLVRDVVTELRQKGQIEQAQQRLQTASARLQAVRQQSHQAASNQGKVGKELINALQSTLGGLGLNTPL